MADTFVIGGLVRKRAELSGLLIVAEAEVTRLQACMAAVDATLVLFDPDQKPAQIPPKGVRRGIPRFRQNELSRTVMTAIKEAKAPIAAREIAAVVAKVHGLDASPKAMIKLVGDVRAVLGRPRDGIVREVTGDVLTWRVA